MRAGNLVSGVGWKEPELVLVRKDDWDAVRGDKCLLEDEVERLRGELARIAKQATEKRIRVMAQEAING